MSNPCIRPALAGGLLLLALGLLPAPAAADPGNAEREAILEEVADELFGLPADAPEVRDRIEVLELPPAVRREIETFDWTVEQLGRFATGKTYLLARDFSGIWHAMLYKGTERRFDRTISDAQARVIRRIYGVEGSGLDVTAPEPPPAPDDPRAVLDRAVETARSAGSALAPSDETVEEAAGVLEGERGPELARVLLALEDDPDALGAAVTCVARLDTGFRFQDGRSVPDAEVVRPAYLVAHVRLALRARRDTPWGRRVSVDDFRDHVLPLRGTSEPFQEWRVRFYRALAPEIDGFDSMRAAVRFVNTLSAAMFTYERDMTWEDLGVLTALATHEGRCEDMVNFENALQRTIGIPAEHVYTPAWARRDGNHAWIGIPAETDGMLSIMGCEPVGSPPFFEKYVGEVTAAKIYMSVPGGLEDVTGRFGPTATVRFRTDRPETTVHLNVVNHGHWRSVGRTRTDADGVATFEDVGCREPILLLPSFDRGTYREAATEPAAPPVVLDEDGETHRLLRAADGPGTGWEAPVSIDRETCGSNLEPGASYQLHAWVDGEWRALESAEATDEGTLELTLERDRIHLLAREDRPVGRPFVPATTDDGIAAIRY